MITFVLLNWKRPENIPLVIEGIKKQNISTKIFLWNNGDKLNNIKVDWLVESSINIKCWPRWFLASQADTPYVAVLDDDWTFKKNNELSRVVDKCANRDCIFGIEGVVISPGKSYGECLNTPFTVSDAYGICVDIVKGRFMLMRTKTLQENLVMGGHNQDDICVSASLAKGKRLYHRISGLDMHYLPDHDGICKSNDHWHNRNLAMQRYFS